MFGSGKKNNSGGGIEIETIIGKSTQFKGTMDGSGSVRIDGKLEGSVTVGGDVVIGEAGEVIAEIQANNVLISGLVKGNVTAASKLELLGTGKLYGDVKAAMLSINEGAIFKGNSSMEPTSGGE